jgi:hypothetical protein
LALVFTLALVVLAFAVLGLPAFGLQSLADLLLVAFGFAALVTLVRLVVFAMIFLAAFLMCGLLQCR